MFMSNVRGVAKNGQHTSYGANCRRSTGLPFNAAPMHGGLLPSCVTRHVAMTWFCLFASQSKNRESCGVISEVPAMCAQTEAFAFMPAWMGTAFVTRGANGWWTMRPPAMIMAHVVYLPYDKIFKAYIFKALGLWNWEAETVCCPFVNLCTTSCTNRSVSLPRGITLHDRDKQ